MSINPRFAKSKNICDEVMVELTLDEKGKVTHYHIERPGFLMFDTLAIRILQQIDTVWSPAKSHRIAQPSKINIPVNFSMSKSKDLTKRYYEVEVFPSRLTFVVDSTSTFGASVRLRDSILAHDSLTNKYIKKYQDNYVSKCFQMQIPSMSSFIGTYGTVRLGFNLTKEGKLSNVQIVHSVSKTMNDKALAQLKLIENDWSPAHEDGIPIDSYVEFDFKFNIESGDINYFLFASIYKGRSYFFGAERDDLIDAYKFLEKEKYEKALEKFVAVENLLLDDIEIKYRIAMLMIFLERSSEGCKKLEQIKSIAIDTGYPSSVNAEMVEEAIGKYCQ